MRVRDEIKMTMDAYQTLYESSIAYGMRKALMAEQRKNNMQNYSKQLTDERDRLLLEVAREKLEIEEIIKRD